MRRLDEISADLAVARHEAAEAGKWPAYLIVAVWGLACAVSFASYGQLFWSGMFSALTIAGVWKAFILRGERQHFVGLSAVLDREFQAALRLERGLYRSNR